MPWLTDLAKIARKTGYPVVEQPGWRSRGHGPQPRVLGVVAHHTAGWGDMHVVRDGRPGLDGPLSQFWLGRDGEIHVVAAGRCWHNAPSLSSYHTNSNSLGIEAENDGRTPWPAVQLDAYRKLCGELCRAYNLSASRVKGHKEVNAYKPDPHSISMNAWRRDVAAIIKNGSGAPLGGDDDMSLINLRKGDGESTGKKEHVIALQALIERAGVKLTEYGVDGDYGDETAEALRRVRAGVGSEAEQGWGDRVSGWAYAQLMQAVARNQD